MKACNHRIHKWRSFAGWATSILLILQVRGCAEVPITHPATETRIADIKKYLPEALPYYDKTKK